ncbi:Sodium/myo-inositol cotransporter, variant 2 [Schistosoma haematobium]|uniref:Sodium/myo-inositol cotransporter, variant 2 n=1 Tax=Schistosoma haematobium TaxID=6185 RepID=A0A922ISF4_SCHHA|nr:Sodium/myo-inositol cotransporter, variant 2 [Schistosoma haematobium]KAH9585897.1 Sodium/myo-inositol cotransporter, variant 2 [Schistosoma haematobium]
MNLNVLDIIVLVIYFVALLCTGIYALFASRRGTVTGYFLAGRFMTWLPVGASLFASNIGSEHFIGLAGSGAAAGIAVGAFELNASILLQLLGWVFLPVYIASGVFTLPEYMKKRYGGERIHMYLALLSLILYIFTKISVNLYSGSLFLTEALKWNTWASIVMLLFLTGLITVTGGLAAVLYTDTLQFFVMIIGALILAIISYINVGGFSGVLSSYGHAIAPINISSSTDSDIIISLANVLNTTNYTSLTQLASSPDVPSSLRCSLPPENAFVLLRGIDDPDMPWLGFLLGQTPASIWYWCTDQMMVQRVLAAKSLSHAQGATLMAGLIKQLPLFLIVIPGMISRILFPDVIGCKPGPDCYRICGQKSGCSNLAYPKLVINIMPSGLRGLMLAVMLAALISDLTSIFNSASTLFTVDVYLKIRKKAKNMEIMVVSRIFIIILILLSIAWIPVIQELQGSQLFIYIQAISAYLAPPVASVYLCAVLIKRTTEKGAFYGLMYGLIIGLIRLILTIIYHEPICGEYDHRPWFIKNIHYMYFALFSFITCGIIVCLLSLNEKQLTNEQLQHLTYWTVWDKSINHSLYNNRTLHNHISSNEMIRNNIENVMSENDVNMMINNIHYHQYENNNEIINKREISSTSECQQQQQQQKEFVNNQTMEDHDLPDKKTSQTSSSSDWYKIMKNICLWFCGCADHPCSNIECNHCCCLKLCHNFTTHIHPNHKKIYVITSSDVNIADNEKKLGNLVLEDDNNFDSEEHYAKITSLKQDPNVKLGLYIGLLFIIILSIFGFIFFSIYFGSISVGPLPISIDKMMINDTIKNAIKSLETHGIITIQ